MGWYLEGLAEGGRRLVRIPVEPLPFRIGRGPGLGLALQSAAISQRHAEIDAHRGGLKIRDLGSTNGTYVNGRRIADEAILTDGDTLHFAQLEFRLARVETAELGGPATTKLPSTAPPQRRVDRLRRLPELLATAAVEPLFQAIVALPGGELVACEALGRGRHPELPSGPGELFALTSEVGLAVDLCRLFRAATVGACGELPADLEVFFNSHPEEVAGGQLADAFRDVRRHLPVLPITVEIHESAITELPKIRALRRELRALGVRLAYDDFGAGQARLIELVEVPPDYLKFDYGLIHAIDRAGAQKQKMLAALVAMAADLGIATIAEGVEDAGEAETCRQLGFTHAQGHYYGPPVPASDLAVGS